MNYLPDENVLIGYKWYDFLVGLETREVTSGRFVAESLRIRHSARNFYVEAVQQILDRFPFSEKIYDLVHLLTPSSSYELKVPSLRQFFDYYDSALWNKTKLEQEWRSIPSVALPSTVDLPHVDDMNIVVYWRHILQTESTNGSRMFPNVGKMVQFFFSLPF